MLNTQVPRLHYGGWSLDLRTGYVLKALLGLCTGDDKHNPVDGNGDEVATDDLWMTGIQIYTVYIEC